MDFCKIDDRLTYNLYISALFDDNSSKRTLLKEVLKKALQKELTLRQLEILNLYFYENLKQKEIALLLGIDKSAVSRHLKKAKLKLKNFLEYNIYFN